MATNAVTEQNNTVAWVVIVLMVLILVIAWAVLFLFASPIGGL